MIDNLKGIMFDMDGTVLDSEGLFDDAQLLLLKDYGVSSNKDQLKEFKGMSYKHFYPRFIKKFQIIGDIDSIRLRLRTYLYNIMKKKLKFIDGFEDFFTSNILGTNIKVALVTNTTRLSYEKIQSCINIDDYFNFVITVNEAKEPKPSPEPYLQAMESLSLSENETIIIEDSRTGLISAVKSNAHVIGITTSLSVSQIKQIDQKILIADSYNDISNYLKGFNY